MRSPPARRAARCLRQGARPSRTRPPASALAPVCVSSLAFTPRRVPKTRADQIADISCLVFNASINAYHPRQRDWVKKQVFNHLRRQANA